MIHILKTHPGPFAAVKSGAKPYEIRKADRPYAVGDLLDLREWNPETGLFTGEAIERRVMYMTPGGEWGLPKDLCVLGLDVAELAESVAMGAAFDLGRLVGVVFSGEPIGLTAEYAEGTFYGLEPTDAR